MHENNTTVRNCMKTQTIVATLKRNSYQRWFINK